MVQWLKGWSAWRLAALALVGGTLVAVAPGCGTSGTDNPGGGGQGATGAVGGTGGGVGGSTACGNLDLCSGACTDLQNDPANCGACGTTCPQYCSQGQCATTCGAGTEACGDKCVDTQVDPANCGACGTACPAGQVCSLGVCGLQCAGGSTKCGDECVDTQTNKKYCGSCDVACLPTEACVAGACLGTCPDGSINCNGDCVNLQSDKNNCGACGTACAANQDCLNGTCGVCDSATTDCDGDGWLVSEGDCCDKPGFCGANPALVNPGAFEVVGNGIDDNCNGKVDLFDTDDTFACDSGLTSNSSDAGDYAKAVGICRNTEENPASKADKSWGLISAEILRADGSPLAYAGAKSIRSQFGQNITTTEGNSMVVLSSGIASDSTQTNPGPIGAAPSGTTQGGGVNIQTCTDPRCIKDWYATPNPPLKGANALPSAPGCTSGVAAPTANDSVMLRLRIRAPTNARAFSFNSYFMSMEFPNFVCSGFNDQFIALVDTPGGTPSPLPNPVDKNLLTYTDLATQTKWPIGINVAAGTGLFAVCNPSCIDGTISNKSCSLGASGLLGTGFQGSGCGHGGTFWLTTAGSVIPGGIVELRLVLWDVTDSIYDSLALIDGFKWLTNATLPGTG